MAYVSDEKMKQVREDLKKALPGWKFSVTKHHHSSVCVAVMAGPLEMNEQGEAQINHYHIESSVKHYEIPQAEEWVKVLEKIRDIVLVGHWDESDSQTDYFNCAFYYDINIGKWDKKYIKK
jgi:hypothetical protein